MKNTLRWTPERYAEHMAQRVAKAQAECDRILGVDKSDPLEEKPHIAPQNPTTPPKRGKYRNQKVEVDGIVHDSGKEARRWAELQLLASAGEITDLQRQVPFVLAPAVRLAGEPREKPAIRYLADFTYLRDGVLVVEDVKSRPTRKLPAYRLKRHLMKTVLNLDITEI